MDEAIEARIKGLETEVRRLSHITGDLPEGKSLADLAESHGDTLLYRAHATTLRNFERMWFTCAVATPVVDIAKAKVQRIFRKPGKLTVNVKA